ncbi:MAG: hypothetical protein AB7V42_12085 [Thermoleophilia bacterium]
MSAAADPGGHVVPAAVRHRAAWLGRLATSCVVSGVTAAVAFLVMIEGSARKGHTDLDFNHTLGLIVKGDATTAGTSHDALGVVGDTLGPAGLYATFACAAILVLVHALFIAPFVRRHWLLQAVPLWLFTFLLMSLVFAPIADAKVDQPVGLFGADAGGITPVVWLLCTLAFAVIVARCHSLISDTAWWEPQEIGLEAALEEVTGITGAPALDVPSSLELPEQGPEQRRVDP